jgi:NADH-quinone oxidoreductase subunit C
MTKDDIIKRLQSKFGSDLEIVENNQPEPFVYITPIRYREICRFVKDESELEFDFLFQLAGVHYPDERFEVAVSLSSHVKIHRMVVKVKLDINTPEIETISDIWQAANWYEREAMELFGIKFLHHPDPRPLLLVEDWAYGYPMRKGWTGPDFIPMPEK